MIFDGQKFSEDQKFSDQFATKVTVKNNVM